MTKEDWFVFKGYRCPWGDYGTILVNGLFLDVEKSLYTKAGMQVPPVARTFHGLVFPEAILNQLKGLNCYFEFEKKLQVKAVMLDWEKWVTSGREEPDYPVGGEPEDYLLKGECSPELQGRIGGLVHVLPVLIKGCAIKKKHSRLTSIRLPPNISKSMPGNIFYEPSTNKYVVSQVFLQAIRSSPYVLSELDCYPVKVK